MTIPNNETGPLEVGQTVTSDSPKVDLGKSKAVVAAVAGAVAAGGTVLATALMDGAIDLNEGIALVVAILAGAGVPGMGAYVTPTTVTRKR